MILQIGDEILPSYVGIVINHDIRIPIEQPGWLMGVIQSPTSKSLAFSKNQAIKPLEIPSEMAAIRKIWHENFRDQWRASGSCDDQFSVTSLTWVICCFFFLGGGDEILPSKDMGVSKNTDTPKWMVYNMENPIKMDDLGVPLFLETPI